MRLRAARRGVPWIAARVLARVLALSFASCATAPPPVDPVKALPALAAADMSCPASNLRITPMGDQTFGDARIPAYQEVEGCSMHVIYAATKSGYVLSAPKYLPPAHAPDHVDVR
jgi:hypothetical protein